MRGVCRRRSPTGRTSVGTVGAGSEMAIDAFLVADADLRGGAVIAT